jgi:siroheme synthase-like protein
MSRLPLVFDLEDVACVIVGAGRVAVRRARTLLRAGARVTVVAQRARPDLKQMAARRIVRWRRGRFRPADLAGAALVFAATSDPAVDAEVVREARRRRLFVNVAGVAGLGTFEMPALLARGPLLIAVSTSGESPALAAALRDDLRLRFARGYGEYVRLIGAVRRRVIREVPDPRERLRRHRRVFRAPLLREVLRGRSARARRAAFRAAGLD